MHKAHSYAAALIVSSALLGACTAAASASGGFLGATSSQSSFNSSSNGCSYSFLFDNFVIRRAAPAAAAQAGEAISQARTASLNAPAHVAGADVSIDVRGAIVATGGAAGQVEIAFAGSLQTFDLSAPAEGEGAGSGNFAHSFTAPAVSGANDLRVTATLAAEPTTEAEIHIDSLDLAIQDSPLCNGQ